MCVCVWRIYGLGWHALVKYTLHSGSIGRAEPIGHRGRQQDVCTTPPHKHTVMDCMCLYRMFRQMFSHVLWRGILAVCVFARQLKATHELCHTLTPLCMCFFCALLLTAHSLCGSICAHVRLCAMNDMCDMCCLSGMPGTSGLLSIGPSPIEMAYQWRYIWKNSLPMQSLLPPPVRERKKSLSHSPRLAFILFLPPYPLLPLSISVSSWRYANRCVSISCQIITIY